MIEILPKYPAKFFRAWCTVKEPLVPEVTERYRDSQIYEGLQSNAEGLITFVHVTNVQSLFFPGDKLVLRSPRRDVQDA